MSEEEFDDTEGMTFGMGLVLGSVALVLGIAVLICAAGLAALSRLNG